MTFKSPYPYFGGKSTIAPVVWSYLGDTPNYVEPFLGSAACLLARPGWKADSRWIETVNDKDGFIANFWRSVKSDPQAVARYADWPVNENDLHARHHWLKSRRESLTARLEGDPDYYDAKIAGWWVWGIACWIGSGWCSETEHGPWNVVEDEDGFSQLVHLGNAGQGINRQLVHLGDAGQGINRKLVHLGDAGQGINRKLVHLGNAGQGINRQLVHLGDAGRGGMGEQGLEAWMDALAERLARVRVCSGDWSRVCGDTPTVKQGLTAVFFDPPYSAEADRNETLYASEDLTVAHDVRQWCLERGDNPMYRIVLCGYDVEHTELAEAGWRVHNWKAHGGYALQGNGEGKNNKHREVLWLSPHCLGVERQMSLFESANP